MLLLYTKTDNKSYIYFLQYNRVIKTNYSTGQFTLVTVENRFLTIFVIKGT